jgi:hypothetical protein
LQRKSSKSELRTPTSASKSELKRLKRASEEQERKLLAQFEKARQAQFAIDEAEQYAGTRSDNTLESETESDSDVEEVLPASASLTPRRESIRLRANSPSADRSYSVHEIDDATVPSCCNTGLAVRFAVLASLMFVLIAILLGTVLGEEAFAPTKALNLSSSSEEGAVARIQCGLGFLSEGTQPTNVIFMATVGAALGALYGGLIADV